ncbi:hypothetical protein CVT24_008186 [Panaeolus cyanescens]|uniref:Uncharacterized protein n=1 Tax=Panaeolus cyanescens TaxID=181874 RepID=A0A409VFK3_9AGAR|nr:hypothetical protein CVT24_008186 [Panaeolus cyanescens]
MRNNGTHSRSPLNPNHRSPTVLSEAIDTPDPAMASEPYQDFEFAVGSMNSESSSLNSSSIRHLKGRGRRSGSGSGSSRSAPAPEPLNYGLQKAEEYNPCAHGYHDPDKRKYGYCGIAAAVCLFPLGIFCLMMDTSRQCKRCGNVLDPSLTAQW